MYAQVTNSRTKSQCRMKKRDRPRSKSAPPSITTTVRQKQKQWPGEAMMAAMDVVRSGELSLSRAAKVYGVPKSTLHYHVSGRVSHGHKSGPKPYLSVAEENEFAILLAKAGHGKTKPVHNIAGMSAHDQGKVVHPMVSHGWFKRFLQRQPQLSYPRGNPTANVRMNCLSEDVIADYFTSLKEELTKNILMNSPSRIYNVDETQICLDGHAPRVVALEGLKKVQYQTLGKVEEGYNLPDVDYIQWLHEIHSDADNTSGNDFVSLADCFPDMPITTAVVVLPELPVEMPAETENNETSPDKATPFEAGDSEMSADRGALPNNTPQSEEKSVEVGCDTAPLQKGINAQPSNVLPNDTTVNSKAVEDEGELQYISKYLVQFVPDTRSQKKE